MRQTAAMILLLVMISACGQKGPLYLPEPKTQQRPAAVIDETVQAPASDSVNNPDSQTSTEQE